MVAARASGAPAVHMQCICMCMLHVHVACACASAVCMQCHAVYKYMQCEPVTHRLQHQLAHADEPPRSEPRTKRHDGHQPPRSEAAAAVGDERGHLPGAHRAAVERHFHTLPCKRRSHHRRARARRRLPRAADRRPLSDLAVGRLGDPAIICNGGCDPVYLACNSMCRASRCSSSPHAEAQPRGGSVSGQRRACSGGAEADQQQRRGRNALLCGDAGLRKGCRSGAWGCSLWNVGLQLWHVGLQPLTRGLQRAGRGGALGR